MNNVNIKVCFFCEVWANGGIESFITEFLSHIDRSKFDFYVITAQKKNRSLPQNLNLLELK